MRILVVEDDKDVAGFVQKGLREAGHVVEHADNGRDGLFMAASESFDAVILDRMLPGGIDGLNILELLRGQKNPVPVLIRLLAALQARRLDDGYPEFQPSNLEVTTIDVGNPATNVIPAQAKARLNIRFNPAHTGQALSDWIEAEAAKAGEGFAGKVHVRIAVSGEAFLTEPGPFVEVVSEAAAAVTGRNAELSTTGGTSDARFIRALCPVVELGLVGASMHAVDEQAPVADIQRLAEVYRGVIGRYFKRFG